jgi:hypothetical protein
MGNGKGKILFVFLLFLDFVLNDEMTKGRKISRRFFKKIERKEIFETNIKDIALNI